MPSLKTFVFGAALAATTCNADIYMHNPRGSNDRNCERNVNRNNGNRMFDSQNNAKGGYACPRAVGTEDNTLERGEDAVESTASAANNRQMTYYEGSYLPIEWTNQHGCGPNGKLNCEIIIQYTCEAQLDPQGALRGGANNEYIGAPRDGVPRDANDAATDTINTNGNQIQATNTENRRFGVHEVLDGQEVGSYSFCNRRERNKGLFTADQNVNRNDATGTRQNPNGNRRGLECPEERDYYPYWAPSPWVDVAILSSHAGGTEDQPEEWLSDFCKYAVTNSQNVKPVGYCQYPEQFNNQQQQAFNQREWPNNERACQDIGAEWVMREPLTGTAANNYADATPPECMVSQFTRVNHLGNPLPQDNFGQKNDAYRAEFPQMADALDKLPETASASQYLWKIPEIPEGADEAQYENCVLRIRYNVSTADYPAYSGLDSGGRLQASPLVVDNEVVDLPAARPASWGGTEWAVYDISPGLDSRFNQDNSPIQQDSYVQLGDDDDEFVSLAVNTNQYGRVFQDRSYNFGIKKRPQSLPASTQVFNVNVQGKRGNIVQTYPAVEYDFVPSGLSLEAGDAVHWQWTGSDYNPQRGCNDAEGGPPDGNNGNQNARADRSNLVEMEFMAENYPLFGLEGDQYYGQEEDAPNSGLLQLAKDDPEAAAAYTFFKDENGDADAEMMKKMAFLQHSEQLAAQGQTCLTQEDLNDINNENQRNNNPRNCAKVNTEHPYFNGGVQTVQPAGNGGKMFGFFSSRNNNFSNRDQTMGICVGMGTNCVFTQEAGNPAAADYGDRERVEPPSNVIEGDLVEDSPVDNDGFGDGFQFGCTQTAPSGESSKYSEGEVAGIVFASIAAGAFVGLVGMQVFKSRGAGGSEMGKFTAGSRASKAGSSKWMSSQSSNAGADVL